MSGGIAGTDGRLRVGDVLVAVNGVKCEGDDVARVQNSMRAACLRASAHGVSGAVTLTVLRIAGEANSDAPIVVKDPGSRNASRMASTSKMIGGIECNKNDIAGVQELRENGEVFTDDNNLSLNNSPLPAPAAGLSLESAQSKAPNLFKTTRSASALTFSRTPSVLETAVDVSGPRSTTPSEANNTVLVLTDARGLQEESTLEGQSQSIKLSDKETPTIINEAPLVIAYEAKTDTPLPAVDSDGHKTGDEISETHSNDQHDESEPRSGNEVDAVRLAQAALESFITSKVRLVKIALVEPHIYLLVSLMLLSLFL